MSGLKGKIKAALHMDKDKTSSDTSTPTSNTFSKGDTSTGTDAYQPLHQSGTSGQSAGTGSNVGGKSASASHATGGSGLTGGDSSLGGNSSYSGTQGGPTGTTKDAPVASNAVSSDKISSRGGNDAGGQFAEGYSQDAPGYGKEFTKGKPTYTESYEDSGDGNWKANLSDQADGTNWEKARERTLAAEREAADAQLSGQKADHELQAAETAENAVRSAQIKYREAIAESEKYKDMMGAPGMKEADLANARSMYDEKRRLAEEAERALRSAEGDLARKERDAKGIQPALENQGNKLPGLEDEYQRRHRAREGAEGEREKLALSAADAEKQRGGLVADLEALEAELGGAEKDAAARQQEYIQARNKAQDLSYRLAELKARLRDADNELMARRRETEKLEGELPAYREAEDRALAELEDAKSEWYRLRDLEKEYTRNWELARDRVEGLRGKQNPKELREAQGFLAAKQDDLDRAQARSRQAEGKYNELLSLADRHKKYGDSAADAADRHGDKYEDAKQDAKIHGDRHVEYWEEAKGAGGEASTQATSVIKKLEERVRGMVGKHEA